MSPRRVALAACLAGAAAALPAAGAELRFVQRLALPATFDLPGYAQALTADPHTGELFVCDSMGNRILIFDPQGTFRYQIPGGRVFDAPQDVAVDPDGYLLVLAYRRERPVLLELDFDGAFRREIALALPEGSAAPAIGSIALSPRGDRIYALDEAQQRLWMSDRDGRVTGSVDLAVTEPDGTPVERFFGRVDVSGETVLVVVASDGAALLLDLDGNRRGSVGEHGTAPCQLGSPRAAALTAAGQVVFVDHQRMKILLWDPATNLCLGEFYGMGSAPGYFYYPRDVALGPEGRLYVAQGFQGRVQAYEGLGPVAPGPVAAEAPP
jgi:DNA-binding beta-propeller fold protein YncE